MNKFRFHIEGHGATEWEDELVRHGVGVPHTAPERMTQLRRKYPRSAIRIEREGEDRAPNVLSQFRFRIKDGEDLRYSRAIQENEKSERLKEIREMYPQAEITEVKF